MDNELEKAKQDLAAAVDAGLKLAEVLNGACLPPETRDAIATLKALKPEPEPERLRCFINILNDGQRRYFREAELANGMEYSDHHATRRAVPMIEIRPIGDVPTWEEWNNNCKGYVTTSAGRYLTGYIGSGVADTVVDTHNAEMRRLQNFINYLLAE